MVMMTNTHLTKKKTNLYYRWKNKRNTHHASTNVTGEDPDINTAPILIWDELAAANFYGPLKQGGNEFDRFMAQHILPYQTRYYFFTLAFARFSWAVKSHVFFPK